MANNKRIAVAAMEIPWENLDCLGVYDSFEEANKACEKLIADYANITGNGYNYEPLTSYGATFGTVDESEDGYEFFFLGFESDCVYVRVTDYDDGEESIEGPFKDAEAANLALFPPKARKKFVEVAGTFGSGYYPVERGHKEYKIIPVYERS